VEPLAKGDRNVTDIPISLTLIQLHILKIGLCLLNGGDAYSVSQVRHTVSLTHPQSTQLPAAPCSEPWTPASLHSGAPFSPLYLFAVLARFRRGTRSILGFQILPKYSQR
jgi:hypothetical protein